MKHSEITAVLQLFFSLLMTHPILGFSLSLSLSLNVGLRWITLSPSMIGLQTQYQMAQEWMITKIKEHPKCLDSSSCSLYILSVRLIITQIVIQNDPVPSKALLCIHPLKKYFPLPGFLVFCVFSHLNLSDHQTNFNVRQRSMQNTI